VNASLDITQIIATMEERLPGVKWTQLDVAHPGADDDGIWFFWRPDQPGEVQLESTTGMLPFVAETDKHDNCMSCSTVEDAVDVVCKWLELPGGRSESPWHPQ
jgi:hypothetical protein